MKAIGLIVPGDRERAVSAAKDAVAQLNQAGVTVYTERETVTRLPGTKVYQEDIPLDAILTLGGDGTLLRGAVFAVQQNVPVLGINLGHTGFLTETEAEDMEDAINSMLAGNYEIDSRPMIRVQSDKGIDLLAVNDAAICRGGYPRLIDVNVYVNGELVGDYRGDGLVVATPTGSTGYSLSAGGPVLAPGVHGMVITPVCAHSLQQRPVVVSGRSQIDLVLHKDEELTALLQVDGNTRCMLHAGDRVRITRPYQEIQLIRLKPLNFFTIIREKLTEWSR